MPRGVWVDVNESLRQLETALQEFRAWGESALAAIVLQDLARQSAAQPMLRARLQKHPQQVLAEIGIRAWPQLHIDVHEEQADVIHCVLPSAAGEAAECPPELTCVVEKALNDAAFRAALLADPQNAIQTMLGFALPAGTRLHVHQNDVNHLHLVIPLAEHDQGELSDGDLAKVAGGIVHSGAAQANKLPSSNGGGGAPGGASIK